MDEVEYGNLDRAVEYIRKIREYRDVQTQLMSAYMDKELAGGWKAALDHPLYLQAQTAIEALQEQLRLLI